MINGKLLTVKEQVEYMKNKGIRFDIFSEKEAEHFLTEHNYYGKISAYRKNYTKSAPPDSKYVHLDFAYLVELSLIDMHLRYFVMKMSLNVEHALKISLLNDVVNNSEEDGYNIAKKFMDLYPNLQEKTRRKMSESYCRKLYFHNESNLPLWVLLEILSFGDLIKFYKFYYAHYNKRTPAIDPRILENVRNIRNAAAHSNCLIHDINYKIEQAHKVIPNIVKKFTYISDTMRKKYLRKRFTLDFTALLIAHKTLVKSEQTFEKTKKELRYLFFQRLTRKRNYFKKNDVITGAYKYCFLMVKNYFK